MDALQIFLRGGEIKDVARAVDIHAHAEVAFDGEIVCGGEVEDFGDVVDIDANRRRDVAFEDAHAIAEGRGTLARERGEFRLHDTDRSCVFAPRQNARQQFRAKETRIACEENCRHEHTYSVRDEIVRMANVG